MPQLFRRRSNSVALGVLIALTLLVVGSGYVLGAVVWSPYATRVSMPRPQPVPFSHKHHVGGLGIDCRYCHNSVETEASAGMPATQICMNCHSYVWDKSPMLAPVRDSWQSRQPIAWTRVYDLPDFVFFNHSIHVSKGVGCETCHGRVDQMPITYSVNTLYMKWCLDCHRRPQAFLRPREQVFTMGYEQPADQLVVGEQLAQAYHVRQDLMECDLCHR